MFAYGRAPERRSASIGELAPSVHWAQEHRREQGHSLACRRIYDFQLLYVKSGEIEVGSEDGERPPVRVTAGQLLLIPPGLFHEYRIVSDTLFWGIHFDFFDELDVARDEDILVNENSVSDGRFCRYPDIAELGGALPVWFKSPSASALTLMESVIHEFTQKRPGYELVCKGGMLAIFALLYRCPPGQSPEVSTAHAKSLKSVARTIELRCEEKWTNERIAAELNLNADYMAQLFQSVLGMSPNKYVQWVRHQTAKRLLRDTDEKIELIGRAVGYEDPAYFSRVFRKWEGMTADTYRRCARMM